MFKVPEILSIAPVKRPAVKREDLKLHMNNLKETTRKDQKTYYSPDSQRFY